ncbi:glycogen synthase GlgA [Streptococcus sp. DD13]|uniref:glycogen synthase GlgA n=1 Tax=Streptococcus sp. DD13 TaxID=1777881 RepID=UPI00079837E7|nr:glycogen synthase GlgA [Streptococcus sp. DD13]KXT78976.1 Glycogen synthase, ADP-glucose transglucosylase [Streptococcus sp. DD13]
MTKKKRVLFVASEGLPYIKSGGLADVIGSLPKELVLQGQDVRVVLPLYLKMAIQDHGRFEYVTTFDVNAGDIHTLANVYTENVDGVQFYFIEHRDFFERDELYGYDDDAIRFGFFQHATCRLLEALDFFPDIIHSHDWHTAAIPFLCRTFYSYREEFRNIRHVFTIHNLAFQGIFSKEALWSALGMNYHYYEDGTARFYENCISYMKLGILYADKVTTVSETYAQEILTDEFGENMNHVLGSRYYDLSGIVNGIDYDLWDAQTDPYLAQPYSFKNLQDKKKNKLALQEQFALPQNPNVLLIGVVSRLTWQKGFYLMAHHLDELLASGAQFVVLGSGEEAIEDTFHFYKEKYPQQFAFYRGYNEPLAHQIYAASDLFFMPSMFEPCGISQLISMHYGTLPLVRETGGLKDTVEAYNEFDGTGTGFSFAGKQAHSMLQVFGLAIDTYYNRPEDWQKLIKQAMEKDVSWTASAQKYLLLYDQLVS